MSAPQFVRAVWAIGRSGFVQLVRSRIYLNILVAGIALVVTSLALDRLAAGEGGRVLFDVGLAFIALVVAVLASVVTITGVTRELETKHAHLLLARPVSRAAFVLGRFVTTALLVLTANLILGGLLALLLAVSGSAGDAPAALAAALFASFEGFILAAIATFFGVGSSSTMSAVFTAILFVLGRLTGEAQTLLDRGVFGGLTAPMQAITTALPHLTAFDLTGLARGAPPPPVATTALYGAAYAGVFLAAAVFRISRRDLL